MRALVTVGAGFIGSYVARALLRPGDEVVILDNFLTGLEELVPPGAELIRGDLRDRKDVAHACEGAEVVYHQGALRSVARSVDNPIDSLEWNAVGTLNLLIAAEHAEVRRLIYASSSFVYGDCGGALQHEDMPTNPRSLLNWRPVAQWEDAVPATVEAFSQRRPVIENA